jgi:hypothetical protein
VRAEVDVPLCARHHAIAQRRSRAEKTVTRLGLWLGLALGLVVWLGLVTSWIANNEGSPIPNLLLAFVVGAAFFLILWSVTSYWLAPRFADRESLRVREAVRILRYWPGDELMELEIENERAADLLHPEATRGL